MRKRDIKIDNYTIKIMPIEQRDSTTATLAELWRDKDLIKGWAMLDGRTEAQIVLKVTEEIIKQQLKTKKL